MYKYLNLNPINSLSSQDCVIRAICVTTDMSWVEIYNELVKKGIELYDMPNSNIVWGIWLQEHGFVLEPVEVPEFPTVATFVKEHPKGTYILSTDTHIVGVVDGIYYDTFDCGNKTAYHVFWKK